ncbi:MAG TPA: ABC transporter ATP-binding protein [Fimbriiglobus sp.]|jgi:ABC-type polysaccharide/polyol phosphate transport system ATPase subunit
MAIISLEDVSLTFTIRQNRNVTLKEFLLKRFFLESVNPKVAVHALSGIHLNATDGDRVGVIGHNGAGKSTLLKLIAGIYPPTKGTRRVEGRICSLFDIALGFEPEATGRENITYRGYLQGETPRSLRAKIKDIEEFSDLGDFLTVPVRYYSAGMMVRLAFSIATASKPEILLIDEVLSVGDMAFQIKARERMKQMMATARLMVVVSHDLGSVEALCNRGMWLTHGGMVKEGPIRDVVSAYRKSVSPGTTNPPAAPNPIGAMAA